MRSERYRTLLPVEKLEALHCSVIGIGAIGRQVCLQLAAMGIGHLQMIDFDHVELANLGPQAYRKTDVGRSKVEATAELARQLNPGLSVEPIAERFARHLQITPVVFCCVDSITPRRHIWNALEDRVECYIDGRMAAEVMRIVTVSDPASRQAYPQTLFQEHEALRETCTARSTIYCANVAAGLMVSQMTQWLRGLPAAFDLTVNLLALELSVTDRAPAPQVA